MRLNHERLALAKRSDRFGKKMGMVICGIFSTVLIAVAVADTHTYYRARHFWTPVTATVSSKVQRSCNKQNSVSPCWWVGVYYTFEGSAIEPLARWVNDESRFLVGTQTKILVNPKNPQDFVFDPPLFSGVTYGVLGAVGLLFACFAIWIYRDIRKADMFDNA